MTDRPRGEAVSATELSHAFRALGLDPYRTDVDVLERLLAGLPSAARRKVLLTTAAALHGATHQAREELRVGAVKVLVALYPESKRFIHDWLQRADTRAFEVHFSLFCYLDRIKRDRRELLRWVQAYLRDVRVDTAQAAWMAGDLLGDHWPLSASLPVLCDAARHATHVAGRAAAVHGLEMAAARLNRTDPRRTEIMRVTREVQHQDRSRIIRATAAAFGRQLAR